MPDRHHSVFESFGFGGRMIKRTPPRSGEEEEEMEEGCSRSETFFASKRPTNAMESEMLFRLFQQTPKRREEKESKAKLSTLVRRHSDVNVSLKRYLCAEIFCQWSWAVVQ